MKLLAFIYRRTVPFSHYCTCNSLVIKINKLKKKKKKRRIRRSKNANYTPKIGRFLDFIP